MSFFNGLSKNEFFDFDLREFEIFTKAKVKKREENLNDLNLLNKNLARLISLAVWGNNKEFNEPLQKIQLLEPEEVSNSEFIEKVNSEMVNFLKTRGLL